MTDEQANRSATDPYVTAFEAAVRAVDGRDVTLETTYFYAEGGGQPADRGTLGGQEVADVQTRDDVTVHTLEDTPEFGPGDTITGDIDDSFRTYCMRAHTASHIVYGAGRKLVEGHGYGGFDIGEDSVRLDFTTDTESVNPLSFQRLANEAVWADRSVEWYEMDIAEARDDDDIVFNLRDGVDTSGTVRIVEIADWDISACGGTHVARTAEVGPIEILDVTNPGADLLRVTFAVGPTAIQQRIDRTRAATRAADTLNTSVENLPRRAEQVTTENRELQAELEDCYERLLDTRIESLTQDPIARNGEEWVVGTVENVGPNTVSDSLRERTTSADVVVLVGQDGSTFVVVGTDGETDANDVIDTVTEEFGGGGGGQPTLAQGGGLDATPDTVVDFLSPE
jgi:alanyl-tRNA synthetase